MTPELARGTSIVAASITDVAERGVEMVEVECPWCTAPVALAIPALPAELRCGECATAVEIGDPDAATLPVAA